MRAWIFQKHDQKKILGDACPWSVGWYDPDGKRKSKRIGAKSMAERYSRKIEGELAAGTYRTDSRKQWSEFIEEYRTKILASKEPGTIEATDAAIKHFERIAKPGKVQSIKDQTIAGFTTDRLTERGRKAGSIVSKATVNKDLRHLKAVLRIAHEWGYLPKMPRVRMVKEAKKLPRYVLAEHFAAMYTACDKAILGGESHQDAADWWRALLVTCYMTGMRIQEVLSVKRDDLDLDAGTLITRHADNKGRRDDVIPLSAVVVAHLRKIDGFSPLVFVWAAGDKQLWEQFGDIQREGGIELTCSGEHEHTPSCHVYGFHDLRRAFATMNAERMTPDALQALMRHKSYQTTQRYISMARQLNRVVDDLYVPEVLRPVAAG